MITVTPMLEGDAGPGSTPDFIGVVIKFGESAERPVVELTLDAEDAKHLFGELGNAIRKGEGAWGANVEVIGA